MKALLAIVSCGRDKSLEQIQRQSFLRNCPIDYRFFTGDDRFRSGDDVVMLQTPDDYISLAYKTKALCRWALEAGYDRLFKCDTDTYVRPERLLAAAPEHEYVGYFSYAAGPLLPPGSHHAYASGGSGYWLGRRAMELASRMEAKEDRIDPVRGSLHGEDVQVGWLMGDHGIHIVKDERYQLREPGPLKGNDKITIHDVVLPSKDRVRIAHERWMRQ